MASALHLKAQAGLPARVRPPHGSGRVHLFRFRPRFRGWSRAAFLLRLRAVFLDAPRTG